MKITITERCAEKIKQLMEKDKNTFSPNSVLRISVRGGGCSGLTYVMEWIDEKDVDEQNDLTFNQHEVILVSDKKSMEYLDGVEVDYAEGLEKSGFVFNNPHQKGGCGCGESFTV